MARFFPPPHNLAIPGARRDEGHSGWPQGPFKQNLDFESPVEGLETKSLCVHSACVFLYEGWPCS